MAMRPLAASGLSPRVRGNLVRGLAGGGEGGSIPACAGEPTSFAARLTRRWVYPRVCGGTVINVSFIIPPPGLSPRVRGNRVRGNRNIRALAHDIDGSIPACAGEPLVVKLLILLPLQIKL